MNETEELQKYIDGELSETASMDFEEKLKTDKTLDKHYQSAILAKRLSGGLLEMDMREVLRKSNNAKNLRWIWIMAASILIAIVGVFLFRSMLQSEPSTYTMEYREPMWPGTRGSSDELDLLLYQFRQGEDLQFIKRQLLGVEEVEDRMKAYWIAEMFLARSEMDSAIIYLPDFPSSHGKSLRAEWFRDYVEQQKNRNE